MLGNARGGGKSKYLCAPQLFYPLWGQKIRSRGGGVIPLLPPPSYAPATFTHQQQAQFKIYGIRSEIFRDASGLFWRGFRRRSRQFSGGI